MESTGPIVRAQMDCERMNENEESCAEHKRASRLARYHASKDRINERRRATYRAAKFARMTPKEERLNYDLIIPSWSFPDLLH